MPRVLILLTASYPYGLGEPFVAHEFPYLAAAFDEVVIVSNNTESELPSDLPRGVTCMRVPYELSRSEKLRSPVALLEPEPRGEFRRVREQYGLRVTGPVRNTIVLSWAKAGKFSRILRRLAEERPGAEVHAYSYWANDMALAAAVARARGWVHAAACRAHRWDVYFDDPAGGFLPFRRYLAEHLDHYSFVSDDGLEYFRIKEGHDFPSLRVARLGTEPLAGGPLGARSPFVLLSCSTMIPRKRVERIAEALAHVRRDMTWIHVGDGPTRGAVERVVAQLPETIRVELAGPLANADVLDMYRARRPSLFVNLSESEGVPVAIMEAMSAGVPVVATAVGGAREIVAHRGNGLLLDPDPETAEVAAAIEAFADMPNSEYGGYAHAAWSTWNSRYNARENYPRFVTEALGRGGC
jgi:colanic acid/amylovoran biosynthesis glycosyltransferase